MLTYGIRLRTHSNDDDAGGFDAIDTVGGFAFVVSRIVGIDIGDSEAATVRAGPSAVLADDDSALF